MHHRASTVRSAAITPIISCSRLLHPTPPKTSQGKNTISSTVYSYVQPNTNQSLVQMLFHSQ
eukprot:m.29499 g.29499  ORF g.29499 m.29499 type:complete len:62 (+) comp13737_c0_seq2:790-975(+)